MGIKQLAMADALSRIKPIDHSQIKIRRSKAGKRTIGGREIFFRSTWEANYARVLQWLKEQGSIKDWEFETVTYPFPGIKRGCIDYKIDFKVINPDDSFEIHEVKGYMDKKSATKLERMAKFYPDVKIVIVDRKQYMVLKAQMKPFLPDWEGHL